jgi:SAM-dependent methyltransferase
MYNKFSQDYDRFVNWHNRLAFELPFLLKQLESVPPQPGAPLRVLDAACGTGQHVIALAKKGLDVTGADLSSEMIAVARANASAVGLDLRLEPVGFGNLTGTFGAGSFNAILCLGNSLPHLLTPVDLALALQDFANCLTPGGILIIQNRNFDAILASRSRWMEPETHVEGDREWVFQRFYDFELDGLIRFNIVTLSRQTGSDWHASLTATHLRPQTHRELTTALAAAGFTAIQSYGSLSGDEFVPASSGNLVLTAAKA